MPANTDKEIVFAAVIGTVIFFILLAFSITYFLIYRRKRKEHETELTMFKDQFNQQLLQSRIEVQEQTFQQIGKELHDNVGQLLSTSRMLIGLTERELQTPPDTLLTANATLGQAINEIRSLAKSLDKEWLERFSFAENIQTMIERINAARNVEVDYVQTIDLPLRSDEQIILFRIVQEAIQNAIKHAAPTHMRIAVEQEEIYYLITVSDNGKGFDVGTALQSMGLANMRHRTELLQGTIQFNSIVDSGTTVAIRLPVKPAEA
jgi:signal transduction histidine kinase